MTYINRWNTCRFCGQGADCSQLVKYGTRHYAHFACYLDAGKSFENLSDCAAASFPYRLLKDRGLLEIADRKLANYHGYQARKVIGGLA
jgi:hypothetical protein